MTEIFEPTPPFPPAPPGSELGDHLKYHYVDFKWEDQQHLSWFDEDSPRKRGFEIQIEPDSEDEIWSDGWADSESFVNWSSDMPDAYLDDLAFDGAIKRFAVGTPDGSALGLGNPYYGYYADWETNRGETDVGLARVSGQATVGPAETTTFNTPSGPIVSEPGESGVGETAYCALFNSDSACYFERDTVEFGTYRIQDTADGDFKTFVRYGDCPRTMVRDESPPQDPPDGWGCVFLL